jgi:hypothetical protein
VRAEIELRMKKKKKKKKKKKRCLQREIKNLKGERIHLRFCELAINLVVGFLFSSLSVAFFLPNRIRSPIIANLSGL